MSESEDQVSHHQSDDTDEQQDQSQADDQQQAEETLTAAETAKLRKELADTRKEAAKHRTDLRKVQADAAKAEQDKAKEAGDFKALYEGSQSAITDRDNRIAELEGQIKSAEHTSLRTRIAAKHKLPADLTDLLRGDDEVALEASAKTLARHIRTDAPDTEAGQNRSRQQAPNRQAAKVEPGKTVEGAQKVAWPT